MGEKLREYTVLGVSREGRYTVRHKTSGEMFSWRAVDADKHSWEDLQGIQREVALVATVRDEATLRYTDTILHSPTNTLYIVLEHTTWATLEEIVFECKRSGKHFKESYIWYLLHEMVRVCKGIYDLDLKILQKNIIASSIYIDSGGAIKIDCYDLNDQHGQWNMMKQLGSILNDLCYLRDVENQKLKEFCYSDDLRDIVNFLTDEANSNMKPDIILYHPTILGNLEITMEPKNLSHVLVKSSELADSNKCNSEKSLDLQKTRESIISNSWSILSSPVYINVSPKRILRSSHENVHSAKSSLSPTIAALALELPGFIPRRNIASKEIACFAEPQQISERTLSQQWMSRLVSLREREHNLNCREHDLISKEIINSPNVKIAILPNEEEPKMPNNEGITLPPMVIQKAVISEETKEVKRVSKRHQRSSSVRTRSRRRQSYNYDDMNSSLSAEDASIIVTTTKYNKDNMPRRSIFPEVSTKKVHFTSQNPFTESDDSVTLTFYELENVDREGYQVPRNREYTTRQLTKDIEKFKYFDLEKACLEKRSAMETWNMSPSKQAKFAMPANPDKKIFTDITNQNIKRTPSKASITSKASVASNETRCSRSSMMSSDSDKSKSSFTSCVSSGSGYSMRSKKVDKPLKKLNTRQSLMPSYPSSEEVNKPKTRKSLLPFKTPFKFMSRA